MVERYSVIKWKILLFLGESQPRFTSIGCLRAFCEVILVSQMEAVLDPPLLLTHLLQLLSAWSAGSSS